MRLTRRRLVTGALAVPAALAAEHVLEVARAAAAGAIAGARPPGSGTSDGRCARCGAADHGILDPRCPLAPRIGRR